MNEITGCISTCVDRNMALKSQSALHPAHPGQALTQLLQMKILHMLGKWGMLVWLTEKSSKESTWVSHMYDDASLQWLKRFYYLYADS